MAKRRRAKGSARGAGGGSSVAGVALLALVLGAGVWLFDYTKTRPAGGSHRVSGSPGDDVPGGGAAPPPLVRNDRAMAGPADLPSSMAGDGTQGPLPQAGSEPRSGLSPVTKALKGLDGSNPPDTAAGVAPKRAEAALVAPFGTSEEVFEQGARVYRQQCAGCHGRPGQAAPVHPGEQQALQIWGRDVAGAAKLAAQPVAEIYRSIADGMPKRAMPAYAGQLSEADLWKLTLLLKNSGEELPDPVLRLLRGGR